MRANEFLWDFCLIHARNKFNGVRSTVAVLFRVWVCGVYVWAAFGRWTCQNVPNTVFQTLNRLSIRIWDSYFGSRTACCIQSQIMLNVNTFSIRYLLRHLKIIQKMISVLTISRFDRTFFRGMICAFRCRNRKTKFASRLKMVKQSQRKELKWYQKKTNKHKNKSIHSPALPFLLLYSLFLLFISCAERGWSKWVLICRF